MDWWGIYLKCRELFTGPDLSVYEDLIILLPNNLNESKFKHIFPFDIRIDPPDNAGGLRHIHFRRVDDPSIQIAYNIPLGTRHDSHKFCTDFPGLKKAHNIIRQEFGLPDNFVFEVKGVLEKKYLLIEALN